MVSINKNILRSALILSYISIIALIVFGISALWGYLNTGADRSKMLHTEIKKIDQYLPKVIWAPVNNEGRPIDEQTLKDIENDYLDAWYVKHVANKTNTKQGIEDYYTESARENLYDFIDLNASENITIESTTLEHHPRLEFFSEDGQLAVITDENVLEYKRIYVNNVLVEEISDVSTYKIVFLLEDGFWRIRHLVQQKVSDYVNEGHSALSENMHIEGINYYPQATPWDMFGDAFDIELIAEDFKIIKDAKLNSIRIFVQYDEFGKADVNPAKLHKLKQTLDAAEANNLKVVVTLFDFYGDYSVLDWTLNHRHAETIVSTFKDHNALMAWDLKNEPDLDFESRGKKVVTSWLENMMKLVRSIDPNHAITIGWSNAESSAVLKDEVDFVSFHYYQDLEKLDSHLKTLKETISDKPIVISEFGVSSYSGVWNLFGGSENSQADYHKQIQNIIKENNIPFMSWTLYDFSTIPNEVAGRLPWRKNIQKRYGFLNSKGEKKPSYKFISN